jgi:hypothetical protein
MRDFLDNLIDRHLDTAPQIKPRLPSMFEPEVFQGGLDVAAPDNNVPEIEETFSGPSVRTKKIAPSHVEPMDPPPFAQVTIPTTSTTVIQAIQPKAAPVVGWHQQTRPPEATVNEGPKPSVPQKEESRGSKNPPVPIVPAREEKAAIDSYPIQTASSRELMGRVRHAHQQKPTEHTFPNPHATAEEQPSIIEEGLTKPVFSLSPRKTPTLPLPSQGGGEEGVREANSTSNPFTLTTSRRERGLSQGLLKPPATLIAPAIPSAARSQKPISQPEPVINVTIGRIEVRATPASAPQPQKTRSAPPMMTLDEYLRQRSHGDRR